MRKKIISILVLGTLVIVIIVSFVLLVDYFAKFPCPPPPKPNNITSEVVWGGGCDGGNWFELVYIRDDTVRFRIYRKDYSFKDSSVATLLTDNNFVMCTPCKNEMPFIRDSILQLISFYNGNTIFIDYPAPSGERRHCFLTKVGLPFGGSELEVYKYNQQLKKERLEKEAQKNESKQNK